MPVIRYECTAEEVRGSAITAGQPGHPCPGTHVPTSVCPIWHAARLLSLAVGLADAGPSREPTHDRASGRDRRPDVRGTPGSRSDRNIPSSEGVVVRFSDRMVPEVYQTFWAAWRVVSSSTMRRLRRHLSHANNDLGT